MLLDHTAKGVFAIAATPFHPDGSLDLVSLERLTDFYLAAGVSGLTILGIMGEAHKLEPEESIAVARQVIARATVPVIVGVSAPGLAAMRSLAKSAMELGAAGVMIAPPSTLRTDDQIVTYYSQAVEAIGTDVPFAIQDYPLILNVVMSTNVIRTIVNNHSSCVMLKHEDWPGLEKISTLRALQKKGEMRDISILCGNGGLFLDFEGERGADGAMTGYAFPDMLTDLVRLQQSGERDLAHDLFGAHLPLLRYEQQQNIGLAVRKYVLQKRGAIAHDTQRKPGGALSGAGKAEVDYLLARLAKYDPRARRA
ncbi:dihydrodipicolinate synthase family protein [Rhizobium giardinii]|uniref:4-hydroxy-tetrahydrodipicolinate synthase n=1 Tax=Rhizobium giardinii TaxID=56731 RepID=A0A7W8UJ12_9HYPH|nr:dihydrodipicolinate synthase family protein [Rhizobium giardinii]MBB5539115.1 4-hydroxy-tetrahydrodipicolinate synthase [Rhizobium giardinii]